MARVAHSIHHRIFAAHKRRSALPSTTNAATDLLDKLGVRH